MLGDFELELCHADMHKALEYYLKEKILKDHEFIVTHITETDTYGSHNFRIKLSGTEKVGDGK